MMPVSLPAGATGATGAIFLELDHGLVIAGGRLVWIADANRIDRFDRARRRVVGPTVVGGRVGRAMPAS
jgi:hypothetical protein